MSEPKRYRKKAIDIEAMQWDGSSEAADAIFEWMGETFGDAIATRFVALGDPMSPDATDTFGADDEQSRINQGFSASLYVSKSGQWANLRTSDWVIKESDGDGFYPCSAEMFAQAYEVVAA